MKCVLRFVRVFFPAGVFCIGALIGFANAGTDSTLEAPAFPVEHGPWPVGYRTALTYDAGRSFGARAEVGGAVHPDLRSRPVRIHLWYPAVAGTSPAMRYGDFVLAADPLGERSHAEDAKVLAAYKARMLERGVEEARLDALLAAPTRARRDAAPERGPFPLIVYAPSINADSYENALFFEYLAGHGFVVASSACIGAEEPEVGRDLRGALAQLGDVRHVLRSVSGERFVDANHVGLMGFSWGGTSVLLLALQHAGIDAVVTLDGGYAFPRYRSIPEATPWWAPRDLRAAFLHFTLLDDDRDLSFAARSLYADTWGRRVPGFRHADFATDAILKRRWAAADSLAAVLMKEHAAIQRSVLAFFGAYLEKDGAAADRLKDEVPRGAATGWNVRPALPAPPPAAQFDEIIAEQGVDAAVARFHEARRLDPEVVIFGENRLLRYAVEWGPERAEDMWKLLVINNEAWPHSAETHYWMGQVELVRGDEAAARERLETALRLDPEHERARNLLARITGSGG
ncbi:MAG: hypothetical protein JW958_04615 [Candidatus Eisenbacteria bacterium]|nr:hypothetical protein [Candidatus Eisenbacteria bacterium]